MLLVKFLRLRMQMQWKRKLVPSVVVKRLRFRPTVWKRKGVRALPDTTGSYTESMRNVFKAAHVPDHMKGVEVQSMPVAFEDVSFPGFLHERRMHKMAETLCKAEVLVFKRTHKLHVWP